jgi:hypothetical protein
VHLPAKTTAFKSTRNGRTRTQTATFKERVLSPQTNASGYLEVGFKHQRRRYRFSVHRLVAKAFVPGYEDGKVVNHLDGNKLNNNPSNLEWVMPGENSTHAWMAGLVDNRGEKSGLAKLDEAQVRAIRRILTRGVSINSLAVIAKVSAAAIMKIRDRKSWAHLDSMSRHIK